MAAAAAAGKSRVLVIGPTGRLGQHLVTASLASGHPTFALARDSSFSDPDKFLLLRSLADAGATLLKGSLHDLPTHVDAIKQVDVVICAVSSKQVLDQKPLIQAIKVAGCIKRFIPSEFGADPDKVHVLGVDYNFYEMKAEIRRLIEKESIPHTYISSNFFMSYLLPSLVQPGLKSPPRDRMNIFGDGNTRAIFIKESDVAAFTISTMDDPRTLNKVLYLRPSGNALSMNELAELWEMKIRKKLEKIYVPEEKMCLWNIAETPFPNNQDMIFIYSALIKGDHTYFSVEPSGLEGTQLYPNVKYTTVSEFLDALL